jgi:hypothetical protein
MRANNKDNKNMDEINDLEAKIRAERRWVVGDQPEIT